MIARSGVLGLKKEESPENKVPKYATINGEYYVSLSSLVYQVEEVARMKEHDTVSCDSFKQELLRRFGL